MMSFLSFSQNINDKKDNEYPKYQLIDKDTLVIFKKSQVKGIATDLLIGDQNKITLDKCDELKLKSEKIVKDQETLLLKKDEQLSLLNKTLDNTNEVISNKDKEIEILKGQITKEKWKKWVYGGVGFVLGGITGITYMAIH